MNNPNRFTYHDLYDSNMYLIKSFLGVIFVTGVISNNHSLIPYLFLGVLGFIMYVDPLIVNNNQEDFRHWIGIFIFQFIYFITINLFGLNLGAILFLSVINFYIAKKMLWNKMSILSLLSGFYLIQLDYLSSIGNLDAKDLLYRVLAILIGILTAVFMNFFTSLLFKRESEINYIMTFLKDCIGLMNDTYKVSICHQYGDKEALSNKWNFLLIKLKTYLDKLEQYHAEELHLKRTINRHNREYLKRYKRLIEDLIILTCCNIDILESSNFNGENLKKDEHGVCIGFKFAYKRLLMELEMIFLQYREEGLVDYNLIDLKKIEKTTNVFESKCIRDLVDIVNDIKVTFIIFNTN